MGTLCYTLVCRLSGLLRSTEFRSIHGTAGGTLLRYAPVPAGTRRRRDAGEPDGAEWTAPDTNRKRQLSAGWRAIAG